MLREIKIQTSIVLDDKQYIQLEDLYKKAVESGYDGTIDQWVSFISEYGINKHVMRNALL